MIIGYEGYSAENKGIADRRRILFWAKNRGHSIVDSRDPSAELIVVTSSADLGYWTRKRTSKPIILDVVDGLIGEQSRPRDLIRGYSYWATRKSTNFFPKSYRSLILELARKCQTVICSSPEQVEEWSKFKIKALDILDIYEELPINRQTLLSEEKDENEIFWEGLPATLGAMSLLRLSFESNPNSVYKLNILTNLNSYKYMNRYGKINLFKYLSKQLPQDNIQINLVEWSPENVLAFSSRSTLGVIPISSFQGYNHLKAENRLLIMWRLGLPVLTSPLKSYLRVMSEAKIDGICNNSLEWNMKLSKLVKSQALREEFIEKAQVYLKKKHVLEDILRKWDIAVGNG